MSNTTPWRDMASAPLNGRQCIIAVQEDCFIYSVQGSFDGKQWNAVHRENVSPLCWMPNIRLPAEFLPPGFEPAALQSAADTPAPQEHLAGTPEVEHMRQKAISNARERNAALRAIQAALDDFELIVERINAGQINRACATAMQGAKEAKLALAATATEGSDRG